LPQRSHTDFDRVACADLSKGEAERLLKRMATFTLRFKMRLVISRESLSLNYRRNRSGVSFGSSFSPIITVVGKAFFDVGHSPKDQSKNRRSHLPDHAAWEIHPVMKLKYDNG
jgi:hypothetical protein